MTDARNTSRERELLPCPFCGGTDIDALDVSGEFHVFCHDCEAFSATFDGATDEKGPNAERARENAVAAWNRRPDAKPLEWNEIAFERGEPCAYNADSASGWWRIDADDDEGVSLIAPDGDCIGVYPSVHMAKKAADKFNTNWLRSWMK